MLIPYQDKTNILKNAKKLKGKNIFINEDFSHEIMQLRKELWESKTNTQG